MTELIEKDQELRLNVLFLSYQSSRLKNITQNECLYKKNIKDQDEEKNKRKKKGYRQRGRERKIRDFFF